MTIHIGPLRLESPVLLAPMSGITDMPFRRLVKRLGAGLVVSEMIASQAMIRETRISMTRAANAPEEHPMAVQLAGCEPGAMAEAARLNRDRGAAIIDINMGCPAKKVVSGQAGSALMRDQAHAARILEATVEAVSLPVTLKMRTGWDERSRNAPRLARIAEQCGIKMVTVHGRTRSQLFKGAADWRFIREVKEAVGIPVVANGDVHSLEDAKRILEQSGADGVMIGRGCYGRPWFLREVIHYLASGRRLPPPPLAEQLEIVLGHYQDMLLHYGRRIGVRVARKHVSWYSKGLPGSTQFRDRVNRCDEPERVQEMIRGFYRPLIDGMAA